jgi:hypothetical protein
MLALRNILQQVVRFYLEQAAIIAIHLTTQIQLEVARIAGLRTALWPSKMAQKAIVARAVTLDTMSMAPLPNAPYARMSA